LGLNNDDEEDIPVREQIIEQIPNSNAAAAGGPVRSRIVLRD